jgi:hypothetical protein
LWHEMMDRMHELKPYGYLAEQGKPIPEDRIARMCGTTVEEYRSLLAELDAAGVPRRTASGIIYCKRMVDDERKRREWRKRQSKHRDMTRDVTPSVTGQSRDNHTVLHSSSSSAKQKPKTPLATARGSFSTGDCGKRGKPQTRAERDRIDDEIEQRRKVTARDKRLDREAEARREALVGRAPEPAGNPPINLREQIAALAQKKSIA